MDWLIWHFPDFTDYQSEQDDWHAEVADEGGLRQFNFEGDFLGGVCFVQSLGGHNSACKTRCHRTVHLQAVHLHQLKWERRKREIWHTWWLKCVLQGFRIIKSWPHFWNTFSNHSKQARPGQRGLTACCWLWILAQMSWGMSLNNSYHNTEVPVLQTQYEMKLWVVSILAERNKTRMDKLLSVFTFRLLSPVKQREN